MDIANKHRKILQEIFSNPVKSNIQWKNIENLLNSIGTEITEGNGSRVRLSLNGVKAVFHRPHPRKETDKGAVISMRRFLLTAGIKPEDYKL